MRWQGMDTAPKTGEEILVHTGVAGQSVVRLAFWVSGEHWDMQGFDSAEELRGWWSYKNSVTQEKLDEIYEPQLWTEYHPPGGW